MSYLYRIVRHPGIYMTVSTLLVLLAMSAVAWLASHNIEVNREIPLAKALGTYAATLEDGTANSRAMGAAILFGLENQEAKQLVMGKLPHDAPEVLSALETLRTLYIADTVFLVNKQGIVVAYSSKDNERGTDHDLSFRPYVQLAVQGTPNVYPAVGVISPSRGIYLAAPLRAAMNNTSSAIGAIVVKVGAEKLDALLKSWTDGTAMLLSPQGVVFAASREDWLFRMTGEISPNRIARIQRTRQFGNVLDKISLSPLPFTLDTPEIGIDGVRYAVRSLPMDWNDPEGDWMLTFLERRAPWWTYWSVLVFSSLAGLITALGLFWLYTLARNAALLENMNTLLQHNEDVLRESEALLIETQAISGLGTYVLDISTGLWKSSDVLDKLFGIGKTYERSVEGWAALLHPDERAMMVDYLKNEIIGQGKTFDKEYRIIRYDDHVERWMHGLGKLEFDAQGHPLKMLGAIQDISEQREREQALEAVSRTKGEFLANMSHEIRTPMNSVLGMAQLALRAEANPKQRDYLKKIQISGEHLLGIIDDILDFSKIEAGKLNLESVYFEFGAVIENLASVLAAKAEEKHLGLFFDIDPSISRYFRGDPLRLSQVLINLINNAIKFTEHGEIAVRARTVTESENDILLHFEVQDTGIGISKAEIPLLFQTFQQGDSSISRKYGGSGLGLAISKQLAILMGGEIGVESEPGKGSTFWFTVRLAKGNESEAMRSGDGQEQEDMAAIHGARILLAEDSLFNQQVASEFLEDAGAIVSVARNGKEALDLLHLQHFDCVLMDMQMPIMDGLEATRLLRADASIARMPVIAMTANVSNKDRERCLAVGMDDFVSKPFKPHALYATLANWLSARSSAPDGLIAPAVPSTEADLANDPNIIDLSILAEMMSGHPEKIPGFVQRFIASSRTDMAEIEQALERNDMVALEALGHRAKSPARMVGAIGFANLCQTLEDCARSGNVEQLRDIVGQLHLLQDRIIEKMNKDMA